MEMAKSKDLTKEPPFQDPPPFISVDKGVVMPPPASLSNTPTALHAWLSAVHIHGTMHACLWRPFTCLGSPTCHAGALAALMVRPHGAIWEHSWHLVIYRAPSWSQGAFFDGLRSTLHFCGAIRVLSGRLVIWFAISKRHGGTLGTRGHLLCALWTPCGRSQHLCSSTMRPHSAILVVLGR